MIQLHGRGAVREGALRPKTRPRPSASLSSSKPPTCGPPSVCALSDCKMFMLCCYPQKSSRKPHENNLRDLFTHINSFGLIS